MSIRFQCPHCQKPFRVADNLAGKMVKCPACQETIRIPQSQGAVASGEAKAGGQGWYILSEDGEQLGPVSKEQLDNLATKGRLSFCQLRRQDWRSWKWADDVYPDLPADHERKSVAQGVDPKDERQSREAARLVVCPDCGNRVSLRAARCPHCGCPAAALIGEKTAGVAGEMAVAPPPVAGSPDQAGAASRRSWRFHAIMAGLMILLAAMIVTPLVIWWQVRRAAEAITDGLAPVPPPAAAEIPAPEPGEALLSPDDLAACIDEAAREMARRIDGLQSRTYLAKSLLGPSLEGLKALDALASGDLDAIPDSTGPIPGGAAVEPYQSQFDSLFAECRDYVRGKVKRDACTKSDVWQRAEAWASEKQRAIEQELTGKFSHPQGPPARPGAK